jgi:hypothetical protein
VICKTDARGNRYVGRSMSSLPPRLHKYAPDGRFRWAVTVPALGDPHGYLDLRSDGSFRVQTESLTEEYDGNGRFVGETGSDAALGQDGEAGRGPRSD